MVPSPGVVRRLLVAAASRWALSHLDDLAVRVIFAGEMLTVGTICFCAHSVPASMAVLQREAL